MNEDSFGEECPCCGNSWKVTHFGAKVWKDCLKCDDKAENLVGKASKNTKKCPVTAKYNGADWLRDVYGPWPQSYSLPVNKDADEDDVDWGDIPF